MVSEGRGPPARITCIALPDLTPTPASATIAQAEKCNLTHTRRDIMLHRVAVNQKSKKQIPD
jgi:hypothetical protein